MDKTLKTKLLQMIKRVNKAMWAGGIMFGQTSRKMNNQNPSRTMNNIYQFCYIKSLTACSVVAGPPSLTDKSQ